MNRFRIPVVAALCGVGFIACAADAPRQASSGEVTSDSTGGKAVDLSTTVSSAPPGAGSGAASDKPWVESAASKTADSIAPKLAPGHKPVDQTSFSVPVRAGVRKEGSRPNGPAVLAGALLPKNRIVAYYG